MRRSPRSIPRSRVTGSSSPPGWSPAASRRARSTRERTRPASRSGPARSIVNVTRLSKLGTDPVQSGETLSATWPNGARMARASSIRLPRTIALSSLGVEDRDLLGGRLDREADRLAGDDRLTDVDLGRAGDELVTGRDRGLDLRLGERADRRLVDGDDRPVRGQAELERRDLLADQACRGRRWVSARRAARSRGRRSNRRSRARDRPSPPGTPVGATGSGRPALRRRRPG